MTVTLPAAITPSPAFQPVPGQRIDPELARSWLLVNAAQPERFQPAEDSAADIVILDIEDAVAPKDKDQARADAVAWLTSGHTGWVRLNGYGSRWWEQDVEALAAALPAHLGGPVAEGGLAGVVLAMVESTDHVNETARRLPGVPVVALVETARGLQRIDSIAAAKGTFRLAFGIGDFRRDTGLGESPQALAYTRSQFTIAAKATGLPGAIDGPTVGSTGVKLAEATAVTAEFGMTGKLLPRAGAVRGRERRTQPVPGGAGVGPRVPRGLRGRRRRDPQRLRPAPQGARGEDPRAGHRVRRALHAVPGPGQRDHGAVGHVPLLSGAAAHQKRGFEFVTGAEAAHR